LIEVLVAPSTPGHGRPSLVVVVMIRGSSPGTKNGNSWRSRRTKPLGRDGRGRIRWLFPSLRGLITPRFRRGRDQTYFLDSIEGFDRRSPSMPRPIWTSIDDHCHPHFRLSAAPSKPSRSHHVAPSSADAPIVFQSRPWHRTPSLSARYPQKLGVARRFDR
jgi:hypothetical protein